MNEKGREGDDSCAFGVKRRGKGGGVNQKMSEGVSRPTEWRWVGDGRMRDGCGIANVFHTAI